MLLARLERISADSYWAHRASKVRGLAWDAGKDRKWPTSSKVQNEAVGGDGSFYFGERYRGKIQIIKKQERLITAFLFLLIKLIT
jgi:hypothetical protein